GHSAPPVRSGAGSELERARAKCRERAELSQPQRFRSQRSTVHGFDPAHKFIESMLPGRHRFLEHAFVEPRSKTEVSLATVTIGPGVAMDRDRVDEVGSTEIAGPVGPTSLCDQLRESEIGLFTVSLANGR